MKRWIGLALILVPILAPAAASFWEGNAALQRGDAAFEGGMFGASNSFAPDTQILVRNLETGKTATVTITRRVEGQSDILILLSPPAASALGIAAGTLASVRVMIQPAAAASPTPSATEQVLSRDPDLNPAAAYGGQVSAGQAATATPAPTPSLESLPSTAAPAPQQALVPSSTPEAPSPDQPAQAATAAATTTGTTEATAATTTMPSVGAAADEARKASDAAILTDAAARTPQKHVFLPPREDKTFAYVPTPATGPSTAQTAGTAQAAPPQITAVIGEPSAAPPSAPAESPALAEAAAPQEARPEEIVGAAAVQPAQASGAEVALAAPQPLNEENAPAAPEPVQTEVTGPPAAPPEAPAPAAVALLAPEAPTPEQPPTTAAVQTATRQATAAPAAGTQRAAQVPRLSPSDTWYVQLAAYATEKGAKDLASTLSQTYPAIVIPPAATGMRMFRVVVGPLNKAESDTLLVWFRFRGFPDAFAKQE